MNIPAPFLRLYLINGRLFSYGESGEIRPFFKPLFNKIYIIFEITNFDISGKN
jgi:hypothetical protein